MFTIRKIKGMGKINPPKNKSKKIVADKLFEDRFSNVYLCAKRKSGKTTVIRHIIQNCSDKQTNIVAFVSTFYKDDTWKDIRNYCENKCIPLFGYTSLFDDEDRSVNHLKEWLDMITSPDNESDDESSYESDSEDGIHRKIILNAPKKKQKKKKKQIPPNYIFILDDISIELKNKYVNKLLKESRHSRCKVLVSSQYFVDLDKQARLNLDYLFVFRDIPIETLELMHKQLALAISFDKFYQIYEMVTSLDRYNFLNIYIRDEIFKINFDKIVEH